MYCGGEREQSAPLKAHPHPSAVHARALVGSTSKDISAATVYEEDVKGMPAIVCV